MPYYSVVAITATNPDWIPDYVSAVTPLVAKYGGKYLARTTSHERVEGDGPDPAMRLIIEWPSKEVALAFMSDPAYAPHLKARTAGAESHHVLIEGKDDLT